jgi:Holliday junction resolvase RusA-like endonuclease
MCGLPHQSKPDLDNLLKGLADAVYPEDDSMISSITVAKVWSDTGFIDVD